MATKPKPEEEETPWSKALKAKMGQRQSERGAPPTTGVTIMLMMPEHGGKHSMPGSADEESAEPESEHADERMMGHGSEMMGEEERLDAEGLNPRERALMARLRRNRTRGKLDPNNRERAHRLTTWPEEDYTGGRDR